MVVRNSTRLENTRSGGWWTTRPRQDQEELHLQAQAAPTCTSACALWHTLVLLLSFGSLSSFSEFYMHIHIPSGFLGSLSTTCFRHFRFSLKSPTQTIWVEPSTSFLLFDHHPVQTGWSCGSVQKVIQRTTYLKCTKTPLYPAFPLGPYNTP